MGEGSVVIIFIISDKVEARSVNVMNTHTHIHTHTSIQLYLAEQQGKEFCINEYTKGKGMTKKDRKSLL